MTMRIVFLEDFDGYKKDQDCYVEVALARRIVRNGKAITHKDHLDRLWKQEQAEKAAKKADAEKLKKAKAKKAEKATSKKASKKEKAVKK